MQCVRRMFIDYHAMLLRADGLISRKLCAHRARRR